MDVLAERDPDFIRRNQRSIELFASYFRPEVRGFENLPGRGPFMVIGNHSGGATPPDMPILMSEWWKRRGVEEPVYGFFHSFFLGLPRIGDAVKKAGALEASPDNVRRVIEAGGVIVLYPGGDHEAYRPWLRRHRIDFAGRTGFIREAMQYEIPIVPVVTHGVQDGMIVLSRGERLALALPYMRNWRLKVYPLQVGPPWGVSLGIPTLPLPTKATVQLCPPVNFADEYGPEAANDDKIVAACYERITTEMQRVLDGLVAERRRFGRGWLRART